MIRISFVGAGYMTTEHTRAFAGLPDVAIAGIYSRTRDKAEALAATHSAAVCGSIAELFERTHADIVVVSVPELAMAQLATECFAYSWLVLLEKPAGYNLADARRIVAAAEDAKSRAYVALNRRAYSSTRAALEEVNNSGRRFIKVQDQQDQLSALRDHGQPQLVADNYMFANSIHVIDYLRLFGRGEITGVTNIERWNPARPGLVLATVTFSSGDIGLYEGIWDGPGPWAVSITTPAKRVELRPLEQGQVQLRGTRTQIPLRISDDDRDFKPGLRFQARQAIAAASGQPSMLATIGDSLLSMQLVADIFGMNG
jgi:predicted dehydrogenase